jgi:hypothetical protein
MAKAVRTVEKPAKVTRVQAVTDEDVQRSKYGGFNIGAAFFGWLVATGLGTLLISLLTAIGSATAFTALKNDVNVNTNNVQSVQSAGDARNTVETTVQANSDLGDEAKTIGIVSGVLLLLALALAYYEALS